MSGPILNIEFIPAIISILGGAGAGFSQKPTLKFFSLLLCCAILSYGFGFAFEYLSTIFTSNNIASKNNPGACWALFCLMASITILLRWLIRKLASERD